jgi:hypothetical protein
MEMKKYTAKQLAIENPELFATVKDAYELTLPLIIDHVISTIENEQPGAVAVHGTFVRIQKEDNGEILYTELQILFKLLPGNQVIPGLGFILFYDTLEQYEAERQKMIKDSVTKHGNETFPTFQNFGTHIKTGNGKKS